MYSYDNWLTHQLPAILDEESIRKFERSVARRVSQGRAWRGRPPTRVLTKALLAPPVLLHFLPQSAPVPAEQLGGFRAVVTCSCEGPLDEGRLDESQNVVMPG